MRPKRRIYRILSARWFLILLIIFALIYLGSDISQAQEPDDTPQNATFIFVNTSSQIYTLSFSGDIDWFRFFAEEDANYQIFTRPKNTNHFIDTFISLYSDATKPPLSENDNFRENTDGSSLIQWLCPISGEYFVKVESKVKKYGPMEKYSIMVTSPDLQMDQTIIQDVPDYSQADFGYPGNCGPVAAACVLGYWDAHGYDLLVDSDPENIEDVKKLVHDLQDAMHYPSLGDLFGGVKDDFVDVGIEMVCNAPQYGNKYNFDAEFTFPLDFHIVMDEIKNKRPVLYGLMGHSIWQDHWMVTIGFLETNTTLWTINHDTWSTTHRDVYVDWDEATDCVITIQPDKTSSTSPPSGSGNSVAGSFSFSNPYIFDPFMQPISLIFSPGLLAMPNFGFLSFPLVSVMPGSIGPYSWGTGNTTMVGNINPFSFNNEGFSSQRSDSWNNPSSPFSFGYNQNSTGFNPFESTQGQFPSTFGLTQNPISFQSNPFYNQPLWYPPVLFSDPLFSPFSFLSVQPPGFGFHF
jgi:hypothetical protein